MLQASSADSNAILLLLRFGKQRAKSSDSGRLSAQERKTPTTELNYGSQRTERATPVGELEEQGASRGQDEAQARMLAEQVCIIKHLVYNFEDLAN